ncbi:UDP-N-acetylglucosamine 2-epimerase [Pararobbsia alpina]|uniref:UDP-N-acetylglucosamine 2-epimerase (non-hydrolyzing) n=2 Tax=Pararobbsia alpina TaxID=621374 RepID=A0A6S7CYS0_9BURK|nr:UDP-N-acetylglucosamine 2-epimerase [Pararobbsia alpina]
MKKVLAVFGTRPEVLDLFDIVPEYDLDLMRSQQTLTDITSRILNGVGKIYDTAQPDVGLVHGDTTTTLAASLAAFYRHLAVGHVEAGLRTGDTWSPWHEELNRRLTDAVSAWHFAPTEQARQNLLNEGASADRIVLAGNSVIDALLEPAERILSDLPNFFLTTTQEYLPFIFLMSRAYLVITDSGGVQEEAPALGKPVLVTRETTERPEAVAAGTARLVGTDIGRIVSAASELLDDEYAYERMAFSTNPYSDGHACERIISALRRKSMSSPPGCRVSHQSRASTLPRPLRRLLLRQFPVEAHEPSRAAAEDIIVPEFVGVEATIPSPTPSVVTVDDIGDTDLRSA